MWFENGRPVVDMPEAEAETFAFRARLRASVPLSDTRPAREPGRCWTCGEPYGDRYKGGDCALCAVAAFLRIDTQKTTTVDPPKKVEQRERPREAHPTKVIAKKGRRKPPPQEGNGPLFG